MSEWWSRRRRPLPRDKTQLHTVVNCYVSISLKFLSGHNYDIFEDISFREQLRSSQTNWIYAQRLVSAHFLRSRRKKEKKQGEVKVSYFVVLIS